MHTRSTLPHTQHCDTDLYTIVSTFIAIKTTTTTQATTDENQQHHCNLRTHVTCCCARSFAVHAPSIYILDPQCQGVRVCSAITTLRLRVGTLDKRQRSHARWRHAQALWVVSNSKHWKELSFGRWNLGRRGDDAGVANPLPVALARLLLAVYLYEPSE